MGQDALPPDEPIDLDELVHRQEDADQPPAMPPESMEDFEKVIEGEKRPVGGPRIPPANPD
jgi:hypothetical protein